MDNIETLKNQALTRYALQMSQLNSFFDEKGFPKGNVTNGCGNIRGSYESCYKIDTNINRTRALCILEDLDFEEYMDSVINIIINEKLYNTIRKIHPTWFK